MIAAIPEPNSRPLVLCFPLVSIQFLRCLATKYATVLSAHAHPTEMAYLIPDLRLSCGQSTSDLGKRFPDPPSASDDDYQKAADEESDAGGGQSRSGAVVTKTLFARMVSPGLCQFNLVVPNVPDGDNAVLVEIGGERSQANALLSIQR